MTRARSSGGRVGRPIGSKATAPVISVDPVAVARECWDEAVRALDLDGRDVVRAAVDAFDDLRIAGDAAVLVPLMRLLRASLDVDMAVPANRAGALPRALAFVPPDRERQPVRDHAIAWTFERLREADVRSDGEFVLTENAAATKVAEAFGQAGIAHDLNAGAVRAIVARMAQR